jgi:hypothetical protein
MSRRIKVLGLLTAGVVAAGLWFYGGSLPGHGGLSASEVFAIRRTIRQQTAEPIVTIRGNGVGAATVTTGRRGRGLDGALLEYYLLRTTKGWEISGRSVWLSMGPNHPRLPTPEKSSSRLYSGAGEA